MPHARSSEAQRPPMPAKTDPLSCPLAGSAGGEGRCLTHARVYSRQVEGGRTTQSRRRNASPSSDLASILPPSVQNWLGSSSIRRPRCVCDTGAGRWRPGVEDKSVRSFLRVWCVVVRGCGKL